MSFQTSLLVEVVRGGVIESEHAGAAAICDSDGRMVASVGDPDLVTFPRSSLKPIQLLALLRSGAADHFGFTDEEFAVMAASHAGEPEQIRLVASILNKIGLEPAALQCGVHAPANAAAVEQLVRNGQKPGAIHNNCSGKHAGMLSLAVFLKAPVKSYLEATHPAQTKIREVIAEATGVNARSLVPALDGCSAPTYPLSLKSMALAFARLAAADRGADDPLEQAMARVGHAMRTHPMLVAGLGRMDSVFIEAVSGLISKGGAEGFQALGLTGGVGRPSLGLALKIADGEGRRAIPYVIPAILAALKRLTPLEQRRISTAFPLDIKNHAGRVVGEFRVNVSLTAGM